MKKILCSLGISMLMAGVAQAATKHWTNGGANDWSDTNRWALSVLPGVVAGDDVILSGNDTAFVTTATTFANQADLIVRSASLNKTGLTIGADIGSFSKIDLGISGTAGRTNTIAHTAGTVTVSGAVKVGGASTIGVYEQTGGALNAGAITVQANGTYNQSGTGAATTGALNVNAGGAYNLTGGTLTSTGNATLDDTLAINGGTYTVDNEPANLTINGNGTLELSSGTWNNTALAPADVLTFNANVVISGGTVDMNLGQFRLGGEFKVIGSDATINIGRINNNSKGDFVFEFDALGVSTITDSGYLQLEGSSITVDIGSLATTGAEGDYVLFDGNNLMNVSTNIDVSSFQAAYAGTYISQDMDTDLVTLHVIPEPATLGLVVAFGGGMLFIRRFIQM